MIAENMTIKGLYVISLALTPAEKWRSARQPFDTGPASETWLTIFAVVALIISLILLIWVIVQYRRTERRLKQKVEELTATKEQLQEEIVQLKNDQLDVLEKIINAQPPREEIQVLNPQEIKALSELGKRLR